MDLTLQINKSLKTLKQSPFSFDRNHIDLSMESYLIILNEFERNVELLAEKENTNISRAAEMLLKKEKKYPAFNRTFDIPNIIDLSAFFKNWLVGYDDEINELEIVNVKDFFLSKNIQINYIDTIKLGNINNIFQEIFKHEFINVFCDLHIPDPHRGIKLLEMIDSKISVCKDKKITIYSNFTEEKSLLKLKSRCIVIKKDISKIINNFSPIATDIIVELYRKYKINLNNEFISNMRPQLLQLQTDFL